MLLNTKQHTRATVKVVVVVVAYHNELEILVPQPNRMLLICVHYNWINIWDEQIKMQRRKLRSDRNLLYRWKSHLAGLAVSRKIFSISPYTSHQEKFETNTKLIKIISSLTYWSLIMAFQPKRSPTMLNINCKLKRKKYFVKFNFINFSRSNLKESAMIAKGRKSRLD